jgi:peroxiredoxin
LTAFAAAEDTKVDEKKADKVAEGQPAPDFTLEAATAKDSKKVNLKELVGKNVVLFFYPKALTGG